MWLRHAAAWVRSLAQLPSCLARIVSAPLLQACDSSRGLAPPRERGPRELCDRTDHCRLVLRWLSGQSLKGVG